MFDNLKATSGVEDISKEEAPAAGKQSRDSLLNEHDDSTSNNKIDPIPQDQLGGNDNGIVVDERPSFYLSLISDLLKEPIKSNKWLIDGVLPQSSMAIMYGDPGSGKSFISLDMGFCISNGIGWHGANVKQGSVIYVAGEGGSGLQKRLKALSLKYNIGDPRDYYISNKAIDLVNAESMNGLARSFNGINNIALFIIDTLNRNCSADENSAKEMQKMISNCDKLIKNTGATVLIVHHSGNTSKDRMRGSSSMRGAIDTEYYVEKKDIITLRNKKMKDYDQFDPILFGLESIDVGMAENGDKVTSAYLVGLDASEEVSNLNSKENKFLSCLMDLIDAEGILLDKNDNFVNANLGQKKVSKKNWFDACEDSIQVNSNNPMEAKRKSFDRTIKGLVNKSIIEINDGKYVVVCEDQKKEARYLD